MPDTSPLAPAAAHLAWPSRWPVWRARLVPYAFIAPNVVLFSLFSFAPLLYAIYISFHDWSLIGDPEWLGFANYRRLVADPLFWQSLANTGTYALGTVPTSMRSPEYGATIIEAMVTGKAAVIYGNIRNTGLIGNLPEDCCVEVPVVVDHNGLRPVHHGNLPPELAAHCAPHVFVQDLTVRAALEGDREAVFCAAMLDRHAASVLTLADIRAMTEKLIEAHGPAMPLGIRSRANSQGLGETLRAAE